MARTGDYAGRRAAGLRALRVGVGPYSAPSGGAVERSETEGAPIGLRPLKVNCRKAAREGPLGDPPEGKAPIALRALPPEGEARALVPHLLKTKH